MAADPDPFLRLPTPVRVALEEQVKGRRLFDVRIAIHHSAQDEFGHTRHPAMRPWITRAEHLIAASPDVETPSAQLVLAGWLGRAWLFAEATAALEAAAFELGADSSETLAARESLASSFWEAGRTTDALAVDERVLADTERLLGHQHPDTLRARANLAASYQQAGRTNDAIAIRERVLADRERLLGDEHPDTITARANLAVSYRQAGRTDEAIALEERIAASREGA